MLKTLKWMTVVGLVLLLAACADKKNNAQVEAPPRYVTLTPLPTRTPSATPFASPSPTDTPEAVANAATTENEVVWNAQTTLGNGTIDHALWTPDGKAIVLSGGAGLQWVSFDPMLTDIQKRLPDYHAPFVFGPDGVTLVAVGPDGQLTRLDAELNPTPILKSAGAWSKLVLTPDGSSLAALGDSEILLVDTATYEIRRRLLYDAAVERPLDIAYTADGVLLVALSHIPNPDSLENTEDFLRVVEAESDTVRWSMGGPAAQIASVDFSPNGDLIRVSDPMFQTAADGFFRFVGATLYDLTTLQPLDSVTMRDYWEIAISHDSTRLASQSNSNNAWVQINELPSGRQLAQIPIVRTSGAVGFIPGGDPDLATELEFSPDDSHVALVTGASHLIVFDIASSSQVAFWDNFSTPIYSLTFAADGSQLAIAGINGTHLYTLADQSMMPLPQTGRVRSVVFSPDGTKIATGSSTDGTLLWDMGAGNTSRLNGVDNSQFLAFSPDGTRLIDGGSYVQSGFTTTEIGVFRTWDLTSTPILPAYADVETDGESPTAFALSADGTQLVIATTDFGSDTHSLLVFDATTGRGVSELTLSGYTINSLVMSPDGRLVYAGGSDGYVRVFEIGPQTTQVAEFALPAVSEVIAMALDPSGAILAIGQGDGTLTWLSVAEADTGTVLQSIPKAHAGGVSALAFMPDGSVLASGGTDGLTRLWSQGPATNTTADGSNTTAGGDDVTPAPTAITAETNGAGTPQPTSAPSTHLSYVEKAHFGEGVINTAIYSPDGQHIILAGSQSTTSYAVSDLATAVQQVPGLKNPVAVTSDGKYMVGLNAFGVGTDDAGTQKVEQIVAWPMGEGESIAFLTDLSRVHTLMIAPDDSAIAVIGFGDVVEEFVEVYSFPAGEQVQKFDFGPEHIGGMRYVAPDELLVALYTAVQLDTVDPQDAPVRIVEAFSNTERLNLMMPPLSLLEVEFSPDASLMHFNAYNFGTVSSDGSVSLDPIDEPLLRRVADGQSVQVPGLTAPIFAFSNNSQYYAFLSFAEQAAIKVVDIASGEVSAEIDVRGNATRNQFTSPSRAFAFSPDDSQLAVLAVDGSLSIFEVASGTMLINSPPHSSQPIHTLAISPDGHYLVTGTEGNLVLWDTTTGSTVISTFTFGPVTQMAFSPDGQHVAVGTQGGNAMVWDYAPYLNPPTENTGDGPRRIDDRVGLNGLDYVNGVAYSSDGTRLVTAGYYPRNNPLIRIWDLTATPVPAPAAPDIEDLPGIPTAIALSSDDHTLAVMTDGGSDILLFDATTSQPLGQVSSGINSVVVGLAFSPDSRQLVVVYGNGGGEIFDVASQSLSLEWAGPLEPDEQGTLTTFYLAMTLSPDGSQVVGGRNDGMVTVWDAATGAVSGEFAAASSGIRALTFTSDGALVVGSEDGIVRLWEQAEE